MRRGVLGLLVVLATAPAASAQAPGTIEGRVRTGAGAPATGAMVLVDAGGQAVTDGAGRYRLTDVAPGPRWVSVAVAGEGEARARVTLEPGGVARVDLELAPHRVALAGDVASGYGRGTRRELTGSVAAAEGVELRAAPVGNVLESLQGLLTGVDVLPQSTLPGANVDLRIRGVRAVNNVDDPLYVVDGLPVARIDDLSAADIESITALKDAAAAAIYGSEAKNGVILVTTRHGREGPVRLAVDARYGTEGAASFAPLMNGAAFAEYRREAARARGTYTDDAALFSPDELTALQQGVSTDWQRLSARGGSAREALLSTGGTLAGTRLGLRARELGQTGITLGQAYRRYEVSADAARAFGPLRLSATILQTRGTLTLGPGAGVWWNAAIANPLTPVRDSANALVVHPGGDPFVVNPVLEIQQVSDETTSSRLTGAFLSELRLPGGFGWQARYGLDRRTREERGFTPGAIWDSNYDQRTRAGTIHRAATIETTVTLHRGSPAAQQLKLLAGIGRLPARDSLYRVTTLDQFGSSVLYGWSDPSRRWILAQAAYGLRNRYFLTLTGRQDGYDALPADARHYRTGAVGAAWQLGEEPFVRRLGFVSELKVRGSFGRITFPTSMDARDVPQQPGGWLVGWSDEPERLDLLDGGLDASLLDGRLALVLDVYRRDSRNQGVLVPVPAGTTYDNYALVQGAATRNSGVEVALSTVNLRGWHGLDWTTELGLAHNHAQVTRVAMNLSTRLLGLPPDDATDPGQQVYVDYRSLGIWQKGQEAQAAAYGATPGTIHVADVNGDGTITDADRVVLGSTYPRLLASLGNRLRYGAFDLSVLVAARLGYTIRDPYAALAQYAGPYNALQQDFWTPDHPSTTAPRPGSYDHISSLSYRSGSPWRVRQATLSWRLPATLVRGAPATLYAGARNPWISGGFRGYDPEYPAIGAPPYRTFFLGASTSF